MPDKTNDERAAVVAEAIKTLSDVNKEKLGNPDLYLKLVGRFCDTCLNNLPSLLAEREELKWVVYKLPTDADGKPVTPSTPLYHPTGYISGQRGEFAQLFWSGKLDHIAWRHTLGFKISECYDTEAKAKAAAAAKESEAKGE